MVWGKRAEFYNRLAQMGAKVRGVRSLCGVGRAKGWAVSNDVGWACSLCKRIGKGEGRELAMATCWG